MYEDLMRALQESIDIAKNPSVLKERPGMPAPTYYVPQETDPNESGAGQTEVQSG